MDEWRRKLRVWKRTVRDFFLSGNQRRETHRPNIKMCPSCGNFVGVNDTVCGYCEADLRPTPSRVTRSSDGAAFHPVAMITIICIVAHLVAIFLSYKDDDQLAQRFFAPAGKALVELGANWNPFTVIGGQWWRVGSYMFLHGGFMHILFNMMAFAQLGPLTLEAFGARRFWLITLITGMVGGVASALSIFLGMNTLSVGFSGALFGYLGVNYVYMRARGVHSMANRLKNYMIWGNVIFIILTATGIFPIDNFAHIGGMVAGLALGFAFESKAFRALDPAYERTALTGLCLFLAYALYRIVLLVNESYFV